MPATAWATIMSWSGFRLSQFRPSRTGGLNCLSRDESQHIWLIESKGGFKKNLRNGSAFFEPVDEGDDCLSEHADSNAVYRVDHESCIVGSLC